jgi:hypothetical protein
MEGTIDVEGTALVCPAPRLPAEKLPDADAALTPVDIRGPFTEDAENSGAEGPGPVDMPPTASAGGTEKDGSSTSIRELFWKGANGSLWLCRMLSPTDISLCAWETLGVFATPATPCSLWAARSPLSSGYPGPENQVGCVGIYGGGGAYVF